MLTTINPQTIDGIIEDGDSEIANSSLNKFFTWPLEIIEL
jgi:hypothetical protein